MSARPLAERSSKTRRSNASAPAAANGSRRQRLWRDLALIAIRRDGNDDALTRLLEAEQLAPDHVHHHRMGQQIVNHLRATKQGRQDPRLAQLDRRTRKTLAAGGTGSVG